MVELGLDVEHHPTYGWSTTQLTQAAAADYRETMERCLLTAEPASWIPSLRVSVRLAYGANDRVVDTRFVHALATHQTHVCAERWPGDHRLPLTPAERCRTLVAVAADSGT